MQRVILLNKITRLSWRHGKNIKMETTTIVKNRKSYAKIGVCVALIMVLVTIPAVSGKTEYIPGKYEAMCQKCVDNGVISEFVWDNNEDKWKGAWCGAK